MRFVPSELSTDTISLPPSFKHSVVDYLRLCFSPWLSLAWNSLEQRSDRNEESPPREYLVSVSVFVPKYDCERFSVLARDVCNISYEDHSRSAKCFLPLREDFANFTIFFLHEQFFKIECFKV